MDRQQAVHLSLRRPAGQLRGVLRQCVLDLPADAPHALEACLSR